MKKDATLAIKPIVGKVASEVELGLNDPSIIEAEIEDWGDKRPNFIESNTQFITVSELTENCITPVFKDNTLSISHTNFAKAVTMVAEKVFGELTPIECRVSHKISGRVPEAANKPASELTESEITTFYQRFAFIAHVKDITRIINGQTVYLTVGGIRSYQEDKLYGKPSPMKFHIFVGWQVRVCMNMMITCDGNSGVISCMTEADLMQKALELFQSFNPHKEETLKILENLHQTKISEQQFCNIIGRLRLYQYLPVCNERPLIQLNDTVVNGIVKGYISNPNFGKKDGEDISCWNLLQLATEAVKSCYIDVWLPRNQSCSDFAIGIQKAIEGSDEEGYKWFLE